jgi:hypothetical protein
MTPTKKALLTIIVSFILGITVGFFGFQLFHILPQGKTGLTGFQRLKTELRERVSLTDSQQARLDSLLQHRRLVFDAFRRQMAAQYHDMREETRDSIRQILSEEQKKRFEMFIKELDQQLEGQKGTAR